MTTVLKTTEHNEAVTFSQTLDVLGIPHWHLSQELWTPSWGQKIKQKQEGFKKGLSDYLVYIPKEKSCVDRALLVFIELKKPKKQLRRKSTRGDAGEFVSQSDPTMEQIEFINKINKVKDVQGFVCYGSVEAIEVVRKFLIQNNIS